jgi:hypothetical protein
MSNIMHKGKRLFNFSEGIARTLTSKTIGHDLVLVVDSLKTIFPKNLEEIVEA